MDTLENSAPLPCPPVIVPGEPAGVPPRLPWGFWVTTGFGVALICSYMGAQIVAGIGYVLGYAFLHDGETAHAVETLAANGTVFSIGVILGAPLTMLICGWFVRLRKGLTVSDYLGLHWPKFRTLIWWGLGLLLLWGGSDALTIALQRPIVPEVMAEIYWNTWFKPLIWLAMVIAGPATEEFIFRGFLFRGWKESRLGAWGTILLTALLWAAIHVQYDLYGIATILVAGIFLGWARLKTGSVWVCTVLHAVMNLIATLQVELLTTPA